MEVKKYETEFGNSFELKEDNKILRIFFGGNLDLYWQIDSLERNKINYETFIITMENYYIYDLFDTLYNDIANYKVYSDHRYNNDVSVILKKINEYKKIFDGQTITWISDNQDFDKNSLVQITKQEDTYVLEFAKKEKDNTECFSKLSGKGISIRFCNSGSSYEPFNIPFMRMYHKLCEYNPNYHQEHIAEYLYKLSKKC